MGGAMTRWLVTGAGGMLGRDLRSPWRRRGEDVTGLTRGDLDITDAAAVRAAVLRARPDVVVNCAAWTAVDEAEAARTRRSPVNGHGPGLLAAACAASRRPADPPVHRLRVRRGGTRPTRRTTAPRRAPPTGAPSWPGSRRCWLAAGDRLRRADRLAVRRARAELRRTMIRLEAGGRPSTWSTTSTASRPGRWTSPARSSPWPGRRAAAGVYHATSSGETTWCGLAARSSGCSAPTRPGYGRPRAPLPAARAAARPTACSAMTAMCRRDRADRRLADGAEPGLARLAAAGPGLTSRAAARRVARQSA